MRTLGTEERADGDQHRRSGYGNAERQREGGADQVGESSSLWGHGVLLVIAAT